MLNTILVLSFMKTAAVVLGTVLTGMAWRAHRKRRERSLGWLTIGMAILTLSAIIEGFAFNILAWSLEASQTLGAFAMALAFGILLYSLKA